MSDIFVYRNATSNIVQLSELPMPWTNNYRIKYYKEFSTGFLNKRSLLTPHKVHSLANKNFILNDKLFNAWESTFKCSDKFNYQFSFYSYVGTIIFFDMLRDLGANFTKLLHVGAKFLYSSKHGIKRNTKCEVIIKPICLYKIGKDKVIFETKTYLLDDNKNICVVNKNDFLLLNSKLGFPVKTDKDKYSNLRKRQPETDQSSNVFELQISKTDIKRYSNISGDYNPVHSNKLIAQLFGFKNVFMHGLMLSNYIIKTLTEHFAKKLQSLDITFTNPVFEGELVIFRFDNNKVEIVDKEDGLKLFGTFKMMG